MESDFKKRGYLVLIGGFLMHLVVGTMYLWGNLNMYVASYLHYQNPNLSITSQQVQAVFPWIFLALGLTMPFGVQLGNKYGERFVCVTASIVISSSIFLSSFATNFSLFALLYGFVFGFAGGALYMIPVSLGYRYFPRRKGLISGVIIAGLGLGSLVFSYIFFTLINPNDQKPNTDGYFPANVADNWPSTLRWISILYFAVMFTGAWQMIPPSQSEEESLAERLLGTQNTEKYSCPDVETGLKQTILYSTMILTTTLSCFGIMMAANYKVYAFEQNYPETSNDLYLTMVGAVGSIFNALSRLLWGWLLDHFTFKRLAIINLCVQIFISHTLDKAVTSSFGYAFYIWTIYIFYGGLYSMLPTLSSRIFGSKVGTQLYGVIFFGFVIACWLQYLSIQSLYQEYGYDFIFQLYSVIMVVGVFIAVAGKYDIDQQKKQFMGDKEEQMENELRNLNNMVEDRARIEGSSSFPPQQTLNSPSRTLQEGKNAQL